MKIWELHSMQVGGAIRSTPEGHADVAGLVLSEKAYLLAVRDYRPAELVSLVRECGAAAMARALVEHYSSSESVQVNGGRALVAAPGAAPDPLILRNDEVPQVEAAGRRL
jgi:hypothetical protein